jgi:uncharacterized protein (TIGR02569 family)
VAESGKTAKRPSADVLTAFGANGPAERLIGGRGLTWRAGDIVVRPVGDHEETTWKSGVLATLEGSDEFTVPRPIPDERGAWVRDGWEAWEWIPGAADESRVDEIVHAGAAFHRSIEALPRPAFIARSDDPWSRADRMAWGEDALPSGEVLDLLATAFRSVGSASQVIHGDLLGNVMFAPGRPPALIDWAPYWRPPGTGIAIAVVDAVCWHGHPLDRIGDDHGVSEWGQLLVRALAFRVATLHLLGVWNQARSERHRPVAAAIVELAEATSRRLTNDRL